MIITCPECSTRYKTSEDAIGLNGRTVRCASCTATWFVAAPAAQLTMDALNLVDNERTDITPEPKISAPKANVPKPDVSENNGSDRQPTPPKAIAETARRGGAHVDMRQKSERRKRNARLRGVAAIWMVPLALMTAAAAGAYYYRQAIVTKYPKTATLYQAVGVDVSLSGLMLEPPETRYAEIDGVPTLVVTGSVKNISSETLALPLVALSLHNASGEKLVDWIVDMETPELAPGARAEYLSQKPNPSLDGVSLRTHFVDESAVPTLTPLQMPKSDTGKTEADGNVDAEN